MNDLISDVPLRRVWEAGEKLLGELDALDLSREIVAEVRCPKCGAREAIFQPAEKIAVEQIRCASCGEERTPEFLHSIGRGSELLEKTPRQIGLPVWDVIWARRKTNRWIGDVWRCLQIKKINRSRRALSSRSGIAIQERSSRKPTRCAFPGPQMPRRRCVSRWRKRRMRRSRRTPRVRSMPRSVACSRDAV
jgi:ribosomal protein S27E